MTVEVVRLSADREPAYRRYVAAHPDALISYTLGYRDLLLELLGCRAHYAVGLRNDDVVGVMPLMSQIGAHGTVLNSLPYFGSSGRPLTREADAYAALSAWYAVESKRDGVVAATVIANPLRPDDPSVAHNLEDWRVAHVTALSGAGDEEARIWSAIDGSARRNVAKARRCGIEVTVENDSFDELESLHRRSMDAIGAQVKSPVFFAAVRRHFRAGVDYDIYIARLYGEAVAALLVFYCAGTVDYYVPAVSPAHRSEQPMAAILMAAMVAAAARGMAQWNWGGSWLSHESLQRFKAKWGGIPFEYRYETRLNDPAVLNARSGELLRAYPNFFVVPFSCLAGP